MPRASRLARCPGCGKSRDVDAQRGLRRAELAWFAWSTLRDRAFPPRMDGMRRLALEQHPKWFWACDGCLASGAAVAATVTRQQLGMGTPFSAYVDRPFRCEDCGCDAVFRAREQRHWFETLRFLIWVYPKQCAPCRLARRKRATTNDALAAALHGLDANDAEQLDAVARLYDELGNTAKATVMRARAKNRRKRS